MELVKSLITKTAGFACSPVVGDRSTRRHYVMAVRGAVLVLVGHLVLSATSLWSEAWSTEHDRKYYFDDESGESAWILPQSAQSEPPLAAPSASQRGELGWSDCTQSATALFSGGGLQRAWRRIARGLHPDKGGTAEAFQSASETRDYLKSPLRYFAYRAMHGAGRQALTLTPFDDTLSNASVISHVRPTIQEDNDGWPRVTVC